MQAQSCKRIRNSLFLQLCLYTACANIPLAKASHIVKRGRGTRVGEEGRRKRTCKVIGQRVWIVDTGSSGRPLTEANSKKKKKISIYHRQIFIVYHHHPGRSREVLHYFNVFHYHFSLCFCLIACKAEKQSEKNTNFGNSAFCTLALPVLAV